MEPSIYTGLGGVALALLRLGLHERRRGNAEAATARLSEGRQLAEYCKAVDAQLGNGMVSFFCGTPGHLAMIAVASHLLGEDAQRNAACAELLSWSTAALSHPEDELLFGRAGYLYALSFVRSHIGRAHFDPSAELALNAERIVSSGVALAQRYDGWPLMWQCFESPYLGAAHGQVGILSALLKCGPGVLSKPSRDLVHSTLRKLLDVRYASGNLPIVLGDRCDEHVHWCHGAPGLPTLCADAIAADAAAVAPAATVAVAPAATAAAVAPTATAATVAMSRDDLLAVASRAAEVVWARGILLKGNGLCHGLAGNAYAFLTMHRLTGDAAHLERARAFASLLAEPSVQAAMAAQPDPQRRVVGVPDSPQSLMEGDCGVFVFLLDLADAEEGLFAVDDRQAAFPGWEL